MPLRLIASLETGLISTSVATATEFDAVSVVASGTLSLNSSNASGCELYGLQAATGATSGVSYGEIDWGVNDAEVYIIAWVKFPTVPSAITAFLSIVDSGGTQLFAARVNASGFWQLNNNANSTVYTSTVNKPVAAVMHRVEIYWKQHASAGAFTVKIDGVADADLTQTGLNNGAAQPRKIRLGVVEAQSNAPTRYIDECMLRTTAFFGNAHVKTLFPIASNTANWTVVGTGPENWQTQIERPWASNTSDLIRSTTANQEEVMKLSPFAGAGAGVTILGVMPVIRHRRGTAGSAAGVTINIKSGSSNGTSSGTLDAGGTTFKTFRGVIQETDPATGVAWTVAALQAALLRIVHDSGSNSCDVNASFAYVAFVIGDSVIAPEPKKGTSITHIRLIGKPTFIQPPPYFWMRGNKKHKVDNYTK